MGNLDFSIDLHHGGKFHDTGHSLEYLRGRVLADLHFELDEWSLQEIVSELKKLGYKGYAKILYCEPGCQLSSGLRELMSDGDAMRMGRSLVSQTIKRCLVYVVDGCREGNGTGGSQTTPTIVAASSQPHPSTPSAETTLPSNIFPAASQQPRMATTVAAAADSHQPLPKTKVFGVKRSGRLKIGVRRGMSQPTAHIDLTEE